MRQIAGHQNQIRLLLVNRGNQLIKPFTPVFKAPAAAPGGSAKVAFTEVRTTFQRKLRIGQMRIG
jgi:hypothetical protein